MYLKDKPEKERLREQLDGAILDLMMYRKHEGESPVLDANIRHKKKQINDLQARIAQIEQEEAEAKEAEWKRMVAELEHATQTEMILKKMAEETEPRSGRSGVR